MCADGVVSRVMCAANTAAACKWISWEHETCPEVVPQHISQVLNPSYFPDPLLTGFFAIVQLSIHVSEDIVVEIKHAFSHNFAHLVWGAVVQLQISKPT